MTEISVRSNVTQEVFSITAKIPRILEQIGKRESFCEKFSVIPKIWDLLLLNALSMTVSGIVFPAKAVDLGIGMDPIHGTPLILLIVGVTGISGTALYGFFPIYNDWAIYISQTVRHAIILPLYYYAVSTDPSEENNFWRSLYFSIPLLVIFGVTNSYFCVQSFSVSALRCNKAEKKLSAFMMSFGIYLGIIAGTVLNLLIDKD